MEHARLFLHVFLHLDKHLNAIIQDYGAWTYLILFAIVFCETGLVVTPILPGDSLLFAAGTFSASGSLSMGMLIPLLIAAAVGGDALNYCIGHAAGPKVFREGDPTVFKKEYLDRTRAFYAKHGAKTIILARFVPIVRTFAPFVAGVGSMSYRRFAAYNIAGGTLWIGLFVAGGYFFGNIPVVKRNFTVVIMAIIFLSILPGVFEYRRGRRASSKRAA